MTISPEQAAIYAQVAPVFMLVAVAERYAILRLFAQLSPRVRRAIGPVLVVVMVLFSVVTVYGIDGADGGLQGHQAVLVQVLFTIGLLITVYVFTVLIQAAARDVV